MPTETCSILSCVQHFPTGSCLPRRDYFAHFLANILTKRLQARSFSAGSVHWMLKAMLLVALLRQQCSCSKGDAPEPDTTPSLPTCLQLTAGAHKLCGGLLSHCYEYRGSFSFTSFRDPGLNEFEDIKPVIARVDGYARVAQCEFHRVPYKSSRRAVEVFLQLRNITNPVSLNDAKALNNRLFGLFALLGLLLELLPRVTQILQNHPQR
mmetsp:Transcript_26708/g.56596  ORF Transcript_26708/g.56596 Transcript_26708/m.56596 type:complete len:209 (-) Transcript_26708:348-974(-)